MATFSTVCTAANDGYWTTYNSWDTTNTSFVIGWDGGWGYNAVMRFTGVTIAKNSTVSSATTTIRDNFGSGTPDIRVDLEAADDPAFPTTKADAAGRSVTGSYVTYATAFTSEQDRTTASFHVAAEAVFARAGWASGQAVQEHWRDNAGTGGAKYIQAYTANYMSGSEAPSLDITYTAPASGTGNNLLLLGVG